MVNRDSPTQMLMILLLFHLPAMFWKSGVGPMEVKVVKNFSGFLNYRQGRKHAFLAKQGRSVRFAREGYILHAQKKFGYTLEEFCPPKLISCEIYHLIFSFCLKKSYYKHQKQGISKIFLAGCPKSGHTTLCLFESFF